MYTGVFRVRVHCRCPSERPCTLYPGVFTARVHGCSQRVRTRYMAVHDPNTATMAVYSAHSHLYSLCTRMCTAVNIPGTRPCTGHVPCTQACLRLRPMNTTLFTARVHGPCTQPCSRSVYTTVYMGRKHTRVQGAQPYTVMYRVHNRAYGCVPCTRPCLRPVYTAVHGHVQTVYTACTAMYMVRP